MLVMKKNIIIYILFCLKTFHSLSYIPIGYAIEVRIKK